MRSDTEPGHRVVVVGGGMAGSRLAQQLAAAPHLAVTVIGEEPHPAYNRVLLAEVLAGRYAPEVIALPEPPPPPGGHPRAAVRRLSGVRAVRVDRGTRVVLCDDGRTVPYDELVLATGSNPVLPPLRGMFTPDGWGHLPRPSGSGELPDGVHPFRTMDDCLALAAAVRPGTRAVVIGGGLLGVSAARALAQRGARVVLAHQGEHLMERQLDPSAARLLRRHVEGLGVEVHTECRVRGLRTSAGAARAVRAVELADGYALEADLVVLACGVRPRVGLARAAGLEVGRGIVVDDDLRTSDPHVFAIGDCAEHEGVVYGLAGAAQEQADAVAQFVGSCSLGVPPDGVWGRNGWAQTDRRAARYNGTRTLTRLSLAHASSPLDLAAFGETTSTPGDDEIHLSDPTRNTYRKVVIRGDRLVGGILLGDLGTVGALARAWEGDEPLPEAPLLHLLTDDGGC